MTTITVLQEFRPGLDFKDITYTFLRDFEVHLKEKGNSVNTVAKHMRQLRTLVNEAINQGYIPSDAYPFRKYKIKQEKGRKEFLTPDELKRLENLDVDKKLRHVLDAFLFCCYTGLRYSDFCQLTSENIIRVNGKRWLHFKSVKTDVEIRLPLHLLFEGKALAVLERYDIVTDFAKIGPNSEANKYLAQLAAFARIRKHITYHTARHTCATLLVHQGVPITTVQKLLGHTSVRTTEVYSEVLSNTIIRDLKAVKRKKNTPDFRRPVECG